MRSYIRHPSDIPIQVDVASVEQQTGSQQLNNISHGGLAFSAGAPIDKGTVIHLTIDSVKPAFKAEGLVTYCRREADHFIIGIEFISKDDLFVARMVEQICHIEHYKRELENREGRVVSGEEAAREWISKFAASFPQWNN